MNKSLLFSIAGTILFCFAATNFQAESLQMAGKSSASQEQCATAIQHNKLMQSDPAYAARIAANEDALQTIIAKQKPGQKVGGVYTIPVVIHVIHLGEAVG